MIATELSNVVRIALVMNGGVSLAVWMGGVTHELDRMLGRSGSRRTSPAWTKIMAEVAKPESEGGGGISDVVVDFVAGTSAGGLNGALLATAIARHAPLQPLGSLWENKARLTPDCLLPGAEKMHAPDREWSDGLDGHSLLDGRFFHDEIATLIQKTKPESPDNDAEGRSDITLLVTATALDGGKIRVEGANRESLDVTDHRRVYQFDSAEDFAATETLARAARASASYPAAFAPVLETECLKVRAVPFREAGDSPVWLMDGGVLANAPFEALLASMTRRPRLDSGPRWIVYVVPSAAPRSEPAGADAAAVMEWRPASKTDADPAGTPTVISVLRDMTEARSEVDLRNALEAMRRLQADARAAHLQAEHLLEQDIEVPQAVFQIYRRTRAAGFAQYVMGFRSQIEKLRADLIEDYQVEELLTTRPFFIPNGLRPLDSDGQWQWGARVASRAVLTMARNARAHGAGKGPLTTLADAQDDLAALNERIDDAYQEAARHHKTPRTILEEALPALQGSRAQLTDTMTNAFGAWQSALGHDESEATVMREWRRICTTEVMLNFAEWHVTPPPPPFDLQILGPGSYQSAHFVVRDESDRAFREALQVWPNRKLFGTRLWHFGAFGLAKHRAHDWRWGRIDGAMVLATQLLDSVKDRDTKNQLRQALVDEILDEEHTSAEALVEETKKMFKISDTDLLREIVENSGDGKEANTAELARSIERVVTTLGTDGVAQTASQAAAHILEHIVDDGAKWWRLKAWVSHVLG